MRMSSKIPRGKTAKSRSDTAVQGTNDSSIVSKCSAAHCGYFDDSYLQHVVAKICRRAPIINRGYYIRAASMSYVYKAFLSYYQEPKQILVLGAGFDTAYFKMCADGNLENTVYFEIDFPSLVSRKCALIRQSPELLSLSGTHTALAWNSEHYKILGVDLTDVPKLNAAMKKADFDWSKPTLVVSEVVLTYLNASDSSDVIKWASSNIENAVFMTYEQIHPHDSFGRFMIKHFNTIGSSLKTIHQYPSLEAQVDRYQQLGWPRVEAQDVHSFFHNVSTREELERVTKLEPFDEFEEWQIKSMHYMVLTAFRGKCLTFGDSLWPALSRDSDTQVGSFLDSCNVNTTSKQSESQEETVIFQLETTLESSVTVSKRFGHAMCLINLVNSLESPALLLCIGGFGQLSSNHGRFKQPHLLNIHSLSEIPFDHDVVSDSKDEPYERMYATLTTLAPGDKCILMWGRLSPTKPCDDVTMVTVTKSENTHKIHHQSLQLSGPQPQARWRHSAVAVTHKGKQCVLVHGGKNHTDAVLQDFHLLDVDNCCWIDVDFHGARPGAVHSHSAAVSEDGLVYISGGLNEQEVPNNNVFCVDVTETSCAQLDIQGSLRPRYSHSTVVYRGRLLLVGGVSSRHPSPGVATIDLISKSVQEYDWKVSDESQIFMMHNHKAILVDDQLVILGGGGNCFSFGTHLNEPVATLDLSAVCCS